MEKLITMNEKELHRLEILSKVLEKRLSRKQAAESLGISVRQLYRLCRALELEGADGIVSKKRGLPSNRSYPSQFKEYALGIIRENYSDFGPTLACEMLSERHNVHLAIETLRSWMIEAGVWKTRKERRQRIYQLRHRRDCFGELIQIDGSLHYWFEDRGPKCTLLVFIDDATSTLVHMYFCISESTFDYFQATRDYLEQYGKPIAFYSDKHSTFRVNKSGATSGNGMTQFGRALHELNIDIICANSPQAKGRVERANKTLQDRLVKELRLEGISNIDDANSFLPDFIRRYNEKFSKPAKNSKDMHRELTPHDNMDMSFTWQEERTVSNSLTIQYDRVVFLLEPNDITVELGRKKVTVYDYPDGRFAIRYKGVDLPYSIFDKVRQVNQGQVVNNKRLGAVLDFASKQQTSIRMVSRSRSSPKRQGQTNSLFK